MSIKINIINLNYIYIYKLKKKKSLKWYTSTLIGIELFHNFHFPIQN